MMDGESGEEKDEEVELVNEVKQEVGSRDEARCRPN